ncbi:MAG: tandem-95 repeat protein, partial [Gammaproteobacteria bacterium]
HTINAKGNDSDVDDLMADLSLVLVDNPTQGTVVIRSGAFVYTPSTDFNGSDAFTYKLTDPGNAESNTVTVTLTVQSVNDEPIANDDTVQTAEDTAVSISPLDNDSDADGTLSASTVTVVTSVTHGQLINNGDGTLAYTPSENYNGSDSFTYTVQDNESGTSNTATVTLTVTSVNDNPVATDDTATVNEDSSVLISPLTNDTDVDGSVASLVIDTAPTQGAAVVNADNTVTYTPATNFNGSDQFTYHAVDDVGAASSSAQVSITVTKVNASPSISGTPTSSVFEDIAYNFTPTLSDQDQDVWTVSATNLPSWLSLNTATGAITGTPSNSDVGVYSNILLSVSDGEASAELAAFAITVINTNDAPVANDDAYSLNEGALLISSALDGVLVNDVDVDGNSLEATLVTGPSRASSFSFSPDGTFSYQHNGGENVSDRFTYTISDGAATSAEATVTITVNPVNDPPVFSTTPTQTQVVQGENYRYAVGVQDSDSRADVSIQSGPDWLLLSDGELTGTAPLGSLGTETVTLVASDGEFEVTQTFTVEVVAREQAKIQIDTQWVGTPAVVGDELSLIITVSHLSGPAVNNATLRATVTGSTDTQLPNCTAVSSNNWTCAVNIEAEGNASFRMALKPNVAGDVVATLRVVDQNDTRVAVKITDASIGEAVVSQGNSQFNLSAATAIASMQLLPDASRELVAGTSLGGAVKLLDYDLDTGVATEIGEIANTGETEAIEIADLNLDGLLDIVVVNSNGAASNIYYNQGNLLFQADANNSQFARGVHAIIQDLNDDGYPEVIIGGNGSTIQVYENQAGVVNDRAFVLNAPAFIHHIASLKRSSQQAWQGRLVLSGQDSVYLMNYLIDELTDASTNSNTDQNSTAQIRAKVQISSTTQLDIPNVSSLQVVDLDGDGEEEIITSNVHTEDSAENTAVNIVSVTANQLATVATLGSASSINVDVGDFNGDGQQDLIVTNENNAHQIYLGTGTTSNFTAKETVISKTSALSLTDDLNEDGLSDILIYDESEEVVDVFISTADGELGVSTDLRVSAQLTSLSDAEFRIRYALLVENAGSASVQDVELRIQLPTELAVESLPEEGDCVESDDQTIRCTLATFAAGATQQFDFILRGVAGLENQMVVAKLSSAAREVAPEDNTSTGALANVFGGSSIAVKGGGSSGGALNYPVVLALLGLLACRRRAGCWGRCLGGVGIMAKSDADGRNVVNVFTVLMSTLAGGFVLLQAPTAYAWELKWPPENVYVEALLGRVSTSWQTETFEEKLDPVTQSASVLSRKVNRTGHNFVAGYQLDSRWSVEVGYLDWGRVELK